MQTRLPDDGFRADQLPVPSEVVVILTLRLLVGGFLSLRRRVALLKR